MPRSPIRRILATLSTCLLLVCLTPRSFAQQGVGSINLQLSIEALEQSVTIDNGKGVSTDSDRNGDALILSGRELEALPDDPEALSAVLQALAGPPQGENGPQVTVNGF